MTRLAIRILLTFALFLVFGCGGMSNPYTGEKGLIVLHNWLSQDPKGFDPCRASDVLSNSLIGLISEKLFQYSYLERPYKLVPCLSNGMYEISEDKLTYTIRVKRGVRFADDPCFTETGGKGRELTARDFIYSWKRLADTNNNPEGYWIFQGYIKGLDEFMEKSQTTDRMDYDEPVEGIRAVDDYTIRIKLTKPYPRLPYVLAMNYTSAVPREAIEYYGDEFLNHPVGTGPFILTNWIHWNKLVFEKNPNFREEYYPSRGEPGDEKMGLLEDAGKRLPLCDRVVFTVIKQSQPAWLYFLSGYVDISGIPKDNWNTAMSSMYELSGEMKEKKIKLWRSRRLSIYYTAFNMNDKVIGLKYPEVQKKEIEEKRALAEKMKKEDNLERAEELLSEAQALERELPLLPELNEKRRKIRKAISLAYNRPVRIKIFENGRAEPAQGPIPPGIPAYNENIKNPYSVYNLEKARKLLAEAGYPEGKDENGESLVLQFETTGGSTETLQRADFFRQEMKKLGIEIKINQNTWTEFQEKLRTNRAQVYALSWVADYPDAENFLQLFYGPNKSPNPNNANYENPEFDKLYEEMARLSDFNPVEANKKKELCDRMVRILINDAPWIFGLTYYSYTLVHSWRKNFKPHQFMDSSLKYQKVDPELRLRLSQKWNEPEPLPGLIVLGVFLVMAAMFVYKVTRQGD